MKHLSPLWNRDRILAAHVLLLVTVILVKFYIANK